MRLQRVLALAALAHALRPYPHPLLRDAAAVAYRAAAAKQFASVMPRLQAALLGNSSKASDRAAGDVLLKAMGKARQTPGAMTASARRGYVRRVYSDRAFQVCELFGAARRAGVPLAPGARVASLGGGPGSLRRPTGRGAAAACYGLRRRCGRDDAEGVAARSRRGRASGVAAIHHRA